MINLLFISGASVGILGLLFGAILAFAAKKFKVEHDPRIEKIELDAEGRVRRSKLYYLRNLRGKAARIREKGVN